MKNTNRYKLVPVLVIGLVCSALNAFAELEMIMVDRNNTSANIEIKAGEKGTIVSWVSARAKDDQRGSLVGSLTIAKNGKSVKLEGWKISIITGPIIIAGPATIEFERESGTGGATTTSILTVKIEPVEKHR